MEKRTKSQAASHNSIQPISIPLKADIILQLLGSRTVLELELRVHLLKQVIKPETA